MTTTFRRAAVISTGTEILQGLYADLNARFLAEQLSALGIDVVLTAASPDEPEQFTALLNFAIAQADIIICSGGLGPTDDDINRDVFAQVFSAPLVRHEESVLRMHRRFEARGREMPAKNEVQALIPADAQVFPNDWGTAPGFYLPPGSQRAAGPECALIALPGPPKELQPMFTTCALPILAQAAGGTLCVRTRTIHTYGRPESELGAVVSHLFRRDPAVKFTILAKTYGVDFRITAKGPDKQTVDTTIAAYEAEVCGCVDEKCIYGADDDTLPARVMQLLLQRSATVALAESCTGGLVAKMLTDIPGSSACFGTGIVSYSNQAKAQLLGVPEKLLNDEGAVSGPVAAAMAEGARRISGADFALGITGIAGPDGGTPEKPVGLVHIALAHDGPTAVVKLILVFDRELNRLHAALAALDLLRQRLERPPQG